MFSFDVNWWAVLVATLVSMAVGSLWYSKILFGRAWTKAAGMKMSDMKGNGGPGYAYTTISALVQALILANIARDVFANTATDGLVLGLMVWLGFVAASTISDTVFSGRAWRLWHINVAYYLVILVINSIILATWR